MRTLLRFALPWLVGWGLLAAAPDLARSDVDSEPVQILGDGRPVVCAFSRDSRRFAIGSDSVARIYDAETAELLLTLPVHSRLTDLDLTSDGSRIVTHSSLNQDNARVTVWNGITGKRIVEYDVENDRLPEVRLSADGETIYVRANSFVSFRRIGDQFWSTVFARGRFAISRAGDSMIAADGYTSGYEYSGLDLKLYELPSGRFLQNYRIPVNDWTPLGFLDDGARFFVYGDLYETATGTRVRQFAGAGYPYAASANGDWVLASNPSREIVVANVDTATTTTVFHGLEHPSPPAAISSDGRRALISTSPGLVQLLDGITAELIWKSQTASLIPGQVCFVGEREMAVIKFSRVDLPYPEFNKPTFLEIWDIPTQQLKTTHALPVNYFELRSEPVRGRVLATGPSGSAIYDPVSGVTAYPQTGWSWVAGSFITESEDAVVLSSEWIRGPSDVHVIELTAGREWPTLHHPSGCPLASFPVDHSTLLTQDLHNVYLWDWRSGTLLRVLSFPVEAGEEDALTVFAQISADGEQIITDSAGKVQFWNSRTGELIREVQVPGGWFRLSSDVSKMSFLWGYDELRVFDLSNGHLIRNYIGHGTYTEGRVCASELPSDADNKVVGPCYDPTYGIFDHAFSDNGRRIATCAVDGTVRIWLVPPDLSEISHNILYESLFDPELDLNEDGVIDIGDVGMRAAL